MKKKRKPRKSRRAPRLRPGSPAARGFSLPHADDLDSLVCRDEDLVRGPDVVKFRYATYVSEHPPGRGKLARWEKALQQGPLGDIPEIDHWAMEEFFWHGVPNDSCHPIEAYLDFVGDRLSPAGQEQLRRWKEARIGFYEIGPVRGNTVTLREWDPARHSPVGQPFQAITLGMGGVDFFRGYEGKLLLTYVSPWQPDENVYCSMGYALMPGKDEVGVIELLLGLRHPEVFAQPVPWKMSAKARRNYVKTWKARDWLLWLEEQMEFPFRALIPFPPKGKIKESHVTGLLRTDAEHVKNFGVYVEVPVKGGIQAVGLTNVIPLDVCSSNWMALMEYGTYREQVGPPPGLRGQPRFVNLR
jgi:hypothetical protein